MSWLKRLFGPRGRLAGAMVLASTLALAGSLFAAPASATAEQNRDVTVRRVNIEGRPGAAFVVTTTRDGGELRNLRFEHGGRTVLLHSGVLRGSRWGEGFRYVLPATTWGMLNPYLGMPFGYPLGHGLGPLVLTTGFHHPGLFVGSIRLGDRDWLRLRGD